MGDKAVTSQITSFTIFSQRFFHNCLFRRRSKKTSNLRVTGLYVGNSPVTGEFSAQKASNAENVSISWRHHVFSVFISFVWIHILVLNNFNWYKCNKQCPWTNGMLSFLWRHIDCDGVSNHQPHDCLLNRLFKRRSKKISKLRVRLAFVRGIFTGDGWIPRTNGQ